MKKSKINASNFNFWLNESLKEPTLTEAQRIEIRDATQAFVEAIKLEGDQASKAEAQYLKMIKKFSNLPYKNSIFENIFGTLCMFLLPACIFYANELLGLAGCTLDQRSHSEKVLPALAVVLFVALFNSFFYNSKKNLAPQEAMDVCKELYQHFKSSEDLNDSSGQQVQQKIS